ncbi:NAD-dependent epimerase/dehydratase family protein, partial [Salmonella enterica]
MTFLKEYVIVSGASGFIGKHLLEALKKSGISVVAITR